jgi:arylsulfatase A-like enzyme
MAPRYRLLHVAADSCAGARPSPSIGCASCPRQRPDQRPRPGEHPESSPAWPRPLRAAPGSPNVVFIVLDDTGYGQLGCYGSPIGTPNFDALAAGGLLYSNMHTTALCSPSRSCIITGRNHHANATAAINEIATGYPGYNGSIPFENGFLSEMLLAHGYSTYMVGKYHLLPSEFESPAGPFDRWPLGRGFERFYGFLGGDTSQGHPDLCYDNHQVEPPRTPEQGYHLTEDLVDKSRQFIADAKQVAPHKPFFLYLCTGATHAPHHVPKQWAHRYAGQFDDGWDAYQERVLAQQKELGVMPADAELSRHDPDVPDWESLPPAARRLAARMMEVYAGFLSHTDHHVGRLLDFLRETGSSTNTLIMVVSDNGASAEDAPAGAADPEFPDRRPAAYLAGRRIGWTPATVSSGTIGEELIVGRVSRRPNRFIPPSLDGEISRGVAAYLAGGEREVGSRTGAATGSIPGPGCPSQDRRRPPTPVR